LELPSISKALTILSKKNITTMKLPNIYEIRKRRNRNNLLLACFFFLLTAICSHAEITTPGSCIDARGGKQGFLSNFVSTVKEARRHLAAAAVARSVSILTMYPVDTLKTRLQMGQANAFRLSGLYKGITGSLIGQMPYGVLTFGSYEMYKNSLLENFPGVKPPFLYAIAAVMGDLTGSGWLCPSEVVKQKMQAGMFSTTGEAVRSIWKNKGIAGLYEGYFGGIARDVPFRVAQLTSYEVTKNFYLRLKEKRIGADGTQDGKKDFNKIELSSVEAATCGAIAGTFSAAITCPLDRIKTLLMTNSAAYGGGVIGCASKIWKEEGIAGFTQGMVPRVLYIAPSVAIFFIAYEEVQQRLSR